MNRVLASMAFAACLFPASVLAEEDDRRRGEGPRPLIEGEFEVGLSSDWIVRSDDPDAEILDLYPEAELTVTFNPAQWLAFNLGLTLEPVLDPLPSVDRYFGDVGLYVDTLNVQVDLGNLNLTGGKFAPGFGMAWDVTPGVYGTEYAEDYELAEMIGFGAAYAIDAGGAGTITLGGNVFYLDDTFLSDSAFTRRGRNTVAAGGPGNTGRLDNFSFTLDGSDIPSIEGFSWHLGYVHLSAGPGDISDVNGFAAGLAKETELDSGITLGVNGEVAVFDGYNGANDDAVYVTGGLSFANGPWHGEAAATMRQVRYFGGGRDNDFMAQLSAGYEFDNGVDLSAGYGFFREGGEASHALGLRLSKSFAFEIAR
ncbi:MAG: hypothetical protein R3D65_14670 [Zhengella sp.]|uniref:hypothetical protein n=1 Tax=Zhengella sp. TaxID=2282762 RepID=UPI0035291D53